MCVCVGGVLVLVEESDALKSLENEILYHA